MNKVHNTFLSEINYDFIKSSLSTLIQEKMRYDINSEFDDLIKIKMHDFNKTIVSIPKGMKINNYVLQLDEQLINILLPIIENDLIYNHQLPSNEMYTSSIQPQASRLLEQPVLNQQNNIPVQAPIINNYNDTVNMDTSIQKETIQNIPSNLYDNTYTNNAYTNNNAYNNTYTTDNTFNEMYNNKYNDMSSLVSTPMLTPIIPPEVRIKKYYISIDSKDRNLQLFPQPSQFQIKFAPTSDSIIVGAQKDINNNIIYETTTINYGETKGIPITYDNIKSIQCTGAIVPLAATWIGGQAPISYNGIIINTLNPPEYTLGSFLPRYNLNTGMPINIYSEPYIYLTIDELKGPYEGTNTPNNNAFAKLVPPHQTGLSVIPSTLTSRFVTLKTIGEETYQNNPVSIGRLDKMTLSLYSKNGKIYNFGIDKLYIESFKRGYKRFNGFCGEEYYTTIITIQKSNNNYCTYCNNGIVYDSNGITTLNSHPIAPSDLLYLYNTVPDQGNIIHFNQNVEIKINDLGKGILQVSLLTESSKSINFKSIVPSDNTYYVYLHYMSLSNGSSHDEFLQIIDYIDNDVVVLNSAMNFDNDGYEIKNYGLAPGILRGQTNNVTGSLFRDTGHYVISVGTPVTNITSTTNILVNFGEVGVDTSTTSTTTELLTNWDIEIDYPYNNLTRDLRNMNYVPGQIFLIQHKLQVNYSFEIECDVRDFTVLKSQLN